MIVKRKKILYNNLGDLMEIDLTKLNYLEEIDIDENVCFPADVYCNSEIDELKNVQVSGNIVLDEEDNYFIDLNLTGTMMLHDSITYDLVPYEFTVKIEETLEKTEKTLDLISFLWHYIVLEVPLRFTINEGKYPQGKNFRIISEEEYSRKNNPFSNFRIE